MQNLVPGETCSEHVSCYVISWNVVNTNEPLLRSMMDEVVVDVNILCLGMVFIILGNGDGRDVVEVDSDGFYEWVYDLC